MEQVGNIINFSGNFNPTNFQPKLVFENEIEELKDTNNLVILNSTESVSSFSVSDTTYFMDNNQFQITIFAPEVNSIANKCEKVISKLLPIINSHAFKLIRFNHFKLASIEQWNRICELISPLDPWGDFGREIKAQSSEKACGIASLRLSSIINSDSYTLTKFVTLEPSQMFKARSELGVYMMVEFSFEFNSAKTLSEMIKLAKNEIHSKFDEADSIFRTIREID